MSEKSNINILKECVGHCPLQVLYSNLDMEASDNCTQYMEKTTSRYTNAIYVQKKKTT